MRLAKPSAVPVWLPNRISTCTAGAVGLWLAPGLNSSWANKPARKPFNQSRWGALNGACSGMKGRFCMWPRLLEVDVGLDVNIVGVFRTQRGAGEGLLGIIVD